MVPINACKTLCYCGSTARSNEANCADLAVAHSSAPPMLIRRVNNVLAKHCSDDARRVTATEILKDNPGILGDVITVYRTGFAGT